MREHSTYPLRVLQLIERFPWVLPILSGELLILVFYPFRFHLLIFVALVPALLPLLFFEKEVTPKKIFWCGFIIGALFATSLSFFTLLEFSWLPETYLFVWMARLFFIPASLITGTIVGFSALFFFTRMRTESVVLNIFLFAGMWALIEALMSMIFAGLQYGLISYTATSIPPLLQLASIGGPYFVSFLIVLFNGFIAGMTYNLLSASRNPLSYRKLQKILYAFFLTILVVGGLWGMNTYYLRAPEGEKVHASFAIIQIQNRKSGAFGDFQDGRFSFPKLETLMREANAHRPDVITYPFSSFVGVLSASTTPAVTFDRKVLAGNFDAFGQWEKKNVHPESIFITWNNVLRDTHFFNEFNFWKNGSLISAYQKRELFPFMDYTPDGAQNIGLYTTPFDITPGSPDQKNILGDLRMANLVCSEVLKSSLSRDGGRWANIFISIGSTAVFKDDVAGELNLINAQFRAAETNRPVIRNDRLGPSAVINEKGAIVAGLAYGEEGVLFTELSFDRNPKETLYTATGNWLLFSLLVLLLLSPAIMKKIPRKRDA